MFFTKVLFGKRSFQKTLISKSFNLSMNKEVLTRFGECVLSPCPRLTGVSIGSENQEKGRPTHFLALRINSPALYKNVSWNYDIAWSYRQSRFNNFWCKRILITREHSFLLPSYILLWEWFVWMICLGKNEWCKGIKAELLVGWRWNTLKNIWDSSFQKIIHVLYHSRGLIFSAMTCYFSILSETRHCMKAEGAMVIV